MKQRTRKLLAGLLSFGMLLQAASPLSALAADASGSESKELKITIGDEVKEVGQDTHWVQFEKEGTIYIDYYNGEYTLTGGWYSTDIQVEGINNAAPKVAVRSGDYMSDHLTSHGVTVKNVGDVQVNGHIGGNFTSENTGKVDVNTVTDGDVKITDAKGDVWVGRIGQDLTVTNTGDIRTFEVGGKVNITSGGDVVIWDGNSSKLTKGAVVTAKSLTMKNTDDGIIGGVKYTSPSDASGYVVMESTTLHDLDDTEYNKNYTGKYLYIGPKTATTTEAGYMTIRDSGFNTGSEYYRLIRYADKRVAWKDDKKPEGIDYASYTSNTYTFYGTLSIPDADYVNLICSDPENDSIKIDGGSDVAIDAALTVGVPAQRRGAKNITVVTNGGVAAIKGYATIDCFGDVSITNKGSGVAMGESTKTATGILVYENAKNVTVTGNSSEPIVGGVVLYNSGNVTLTNPSGSITGGYIKVDKSNGDVKITGNSSEGLALFRSTSVKENTINANSVTLCNAGGPVGKTTVQVPSTEGYKYVAGASESDPDRIETVLDSVKASYTGTDKYLYVGPGTPEAAREELSITVDGTVYTFGKDAKGVFIGGSNANPRVFYNADTKVYSISGGFTGDVVISGMNGQKPNIKMDNGNGSIATGSLTVSDVTDFKADSSVGCVADGTLTITADGDVELEGNFVETIVKAKSLTMQSRKNSLGKVTFTAPDGKTYTASTNESGSDTIDVPKGDNVNSGYLHIGEDTTPAPHEHTAGTEWKSDGTYHWHTCTTCDEDAQLDKAEHSYDSNGVCKECGYKKPTDPTPTPDPDPTPKPHEHTTGTEWKSDGTYHWHTCTTCDEDVQLDKAEHSYDSNGVCAECGYKKPTDPTPTPDPDPTPDHKHTAGTEWKSDGTYHWHTCTTCDEDAQLDKALHDFGEDGSAKTCAECGYANPDYKEPDQPDTPDTPDVPDTDDTGSGLGAFVAGAAIGGTVLFVGYEAVTDAILSDLLPAGAATPVNRGQLAWLIWGTKGAPAPANQPAFTDVPNAEMAQAAQWCVEQGIMTAEGGKFSPDGWVPKFKVIETWNNAFPKQ